MTSDSRCRLTTSGTGPHQGVRAAHDCARRVRIHRTGRPSPDGTGTGMDHSRSPSCGLHPLRCGQHGPCDASLHDGQDRPGGRSEGIHAARSRSTCGRRQGAKTPGLKTPHAGLPHGTMGETLNTNGRRRVPGYGRDGWSGKARVEPPVAAGHQSQIISTWPRKATFGAMCAFYLIRHLPEGRHARTTDLRRTRISLGASRRAHSTQTGRDTFGFCEIRIRHLRRFILPPEGKTTK